MRAQQRDVDQAYIPNVALVSLADPTYLNCTINLLQMARMGGWTSPIILLSVGRENMEPSSERVLQTLGVLVVETDSALDTVIRAKPGYTSLDPRRVKFRKMDIFYNPIFRTFDRLIYMDPDGVIAGDMRLLLHVSFPRGVSVLMRQNEKTLGKPPLHEGEMNFSSMNGTERGIFAKRFPNRLKVGASCWFIVNTKNLRAPTDLLEESKAILAQFHHGFRLNDQTLMNLLFYDELDIFPWCIWEELPIAVSSDMLREFCESNMSYQKWFYGQLSFIYRHMSPSEKKRCLGRTSRT